MGVLTDFSVIKIVTNKNMAGWLMTSKAVPQHTDISWFYSLFLDKRGSFIGFSDGLKALWTKISSHLPVSSSTW